MASTAIAFDTLAYFQKLTAAGVPEQQAQIQADTLREVVQIKLTSVDGTVATKNDLQSLRTEFSNENGALATKADLQAVEAVFKADLQAVEAVFKADLQAVEAVFKADLQSVRTEIIAANATLKHDLLKWMVGLLMGQAAFIFALLRMIGAFNK
jgi:hypothetical protein